MIRYFKGPEETLFGVAETIRIWCPECGVPNSGSLDILNGRKSILCTCGYATPVNLFATGTPCDATGRPIASPAVQKVQPTEAPKPPAPPAPPPPATKNVSTATVAPPAKAPDKPSPQTLPADKAK